MSNVNFQEWRKCNIWYVYAIWTMIYSPFINYTSVESINVRIDKSWTAIYRLLIIWKYISKIKYHSSTIVCLHHLDANETLGEKAS